MQNQEDKQIFQRVKWQQKPKLQPHPAKRWGHTTINSGSYLYIMGGRLADSAKSREYAYRIHCQTFQCEPIQLTDNPMMRQSHSCSLINGLIYVLFGINKSSKVLNDCLEIKITSNSLIWQKKNQIQQIQGRQSHMSVILSDRYILIYGGYNSEEKLIEDFQLYDTVEQKWRKVTKIEGEIQVKAGGTLINIKNQIYLFGGETNEQNQYSNQLYKIEISHYTRTDKNEESQIKVVKLNPKGIRPCPRSQFASVVYKNRYLIVLGGEGSANEKGDSARLLSDIWVYDTQKSKWDEIVPENPHVFKPRSSFTANLYKQSLIIFGGIVSFKDFKSSDQIFVLNLNTQVQKKPICNLCKSSYNAFPKQQIQVQNTRAVKNSPKFFTSFSTIFAISKMIENPFVALGTFLHTLSFLEVQKCSLILSQNMLSLKLSNININENEWKSILTSYEYSPLIEYIDNRVRKALQRQIRVNLINYFGYNLKNTCLRIGNQFLLSWVNSHNELEICLMNKYGVYYSQNINSSQKDMPTSETSIILQFLKEYQIDITNLLKASMSIYITSLKYDSTNKYKQQISYDPFLDDMVYSNQKFKDYLKILFSNKFSLALSVSNKQVDFVQTSKFITLGQNKNEKLPQQNSYPDLFEEIFTYKRPGFSMILLYQSNKLMHYKQIKSFSGIAIEFHLAKKIQSNITFSNITPTNLLIEAITSVTKKLRQNPPNIIKRNKPLKLQQFEETFYNPQFYENGTKMVKKTQDGSHQNGIDMKILKE